MPTFPPPMPSSTARSVRGWRRLPFASLDRHQWINLGLAALCASHVARFAYFVVFTGLFKDAGVDFRSFWSAAEVAQNLGFARVYDLSALEVYQRPLFHLYPSLGEPREYVTVPTPYLPVFVAALIPLLPLGPTVGFTLWTALSGIAIFFYLYRFTLAVGRQGSGRLRLVPQLLSMPVAAGLLSGQVSAFLLVFVGEFILSLVAGRRVVAGLWLGLLLWKPQLLILVLPGLLLARRKDTLIGFGVTTLGVLGGSAYLLGFSGLQSLATLWTGYAGGMASNSPEVMMNWRAVWLNLGPLVSRDVQLALLVAGMLVTAVLPLWLWYQAGPRGNGGLPEALLATFAATNVVAWHSHLHMAVPTIAVVAYAFARGVIPHWLAYLWLLGPVLAYLVTLPTTMSQQYCGLATFLMNVVVELWAAVVFLRARPRPVEVAGPEPGPIARSELESASEVN